jgi:5-methylcytosine-specific restriction enzyme subunit McrC
VALYQITEYGQIKSLDEVKKPIRNNEICIPGDSFNNLWSFVLEKQSNSDSLDKAFELYTRGGKRIIKAKNYVGVVETKTKDVIEVLPKIYGIDSSSDAKKIFLKMLKVLKKFNNLSFQDASLYSKDDFPILELFISNYVIEAERLLLQGLKKGYVINESNQPFLKGKLLFKHHLRYNFVDKSKFFVAFSQFESDIPVNRILKSTLEKLLNLTKLNSNRRKISRLRDILDCIPFSTNITGDLSSIRNSNRLFSNYSKIIEWSEIFLLNKGFTNFSGKNINQAMLFPMEKVFESFVAYQIRKYIKSFKVSTQHMKFHLVEKYREKPKYKLKPDIFASKSEGDGCIIIDTKWKVIDEKTKGKSIQQSDMYQLYAYGRKYLKGYGEPILYLIYPKNSQFTEELPPFYYEKEGDFWLKLYARPFDLRDKYKAQVTALFDSFDKAQEIEESPTMALAAEPDVYYGGKKD